MNLFKNRNLVIASKHGKERVLAPLLKEKLELLPFPAHNLDTDAFGTFTGEIERTLSPLEAAKHKCREALKLENCDLAIASEGSFGQHPFYSFIPADEELLYFIDAKHNIEIVQRELSTHTNFNAAPVNHPGELLSFAKLAGFPSHGLILRTTDQAGRSEIVKGITDERALLDTFNRFAREDAQISIETDMRAHVNPTRMQVIKDCAIKLINRIQSLCPTCDWPGFGVIDAIPGLPCERCDFPTRSTLKHVYQCSRCKYTHDLQFPHGKRVEEATFCDYCNP